MRSWFEALRRPIRQSFVKYRLLRLYRKHGFPVTAALKKLVETWSEVAGMQNLNAKKVQEHFARTLLDRSLGDIPYMTFFDPADICVGSQVNTYRLVSMFLGSQVIPLGSGAGVDLLLTADDRLVGFADYLILSWSGSQAPWREGLMGFLGGTEPVELGNAVPEDQMKTLEEYFGERHSPEKK